MTIPYTFAGATTAIPLAQLDANFASPITLGNVAMTLSNTYTSIGNLTLTNVTISSASGLAANTVAYANASGVLGGSANMTFDGSTLTTLNTAYTGTLTGGTGVVNLGSGQFYKTSAGLVGLGTTSPSYQLHSYSNANQSILTYTQNASSGTGAYAGTESVSNTVELPLRAYSSTFNTFAHAGIALAGWAEIFASTISGAGPQGFLIGLDTANPLVFATNSTERMRITSAGSVQSTNGLGASSAKSQNTLYPTVMIGGSSGTTSCTNTISYYQAGGAWEPMVYFVTVSASKGDLSAVANANYVIRMTHYNGGTANSISTSGGDTGQFTLSYSNTGSATGGINTSAITATVSASYDHIVMSIQAASWAGISSIT